MDEKTLIIGDNNNNVYLVFDKENNYQRHYKAYACYRKILL